MDDLTYYLWTFKLEHVVCNIISGSYEGARSRINILFPKKVETINVELISVSEFWLPWISAEKISKSFDRVAESAKNEDK